MGKINKENAHRLSNEVGFVRDYQALIGGGVEMVVTVGGSGSRSIAAASVAGTYEVVIKLQRTVDGVTMPFKMLDGKDFTSGVATSKTGSSNTVALTTTTVNFTGGVFTTTLTIGGTVAATDTAVVTPADITDLSRTITAATAITITAS